MIKLIDVRVYILSMLVCFLCGCAAQNGNVTGSSNSAQAEAKRYFQLADSTKDATAQTYRLQGIEQLLLAENTEQAAQMLYTNGSEQNMNQEQKSFNNILKAKLALAKRDTYTAQKHLKAIWTPHQLSQELQIKFYTTRSEAYRRNGNLLQAVQERIYLSQHLQSPIDQKTNNQVIWETLSQLTPTTLRLLQKGTNSPELSAWISFANITKQYDASSAQMFRALQMWQQKYPRHPAISFMPESIIEAPQPLARPKKIALILPLKGQHAKSAQAVRDGFLAAFYVQKEDLDKPKIQIYDTTEYSNLTTLYQRAVEDGADFIVGPLIKEDVESISFATKNRAPILALNTTNTRRTRENLFQFSLSPEQEAEAVATKAWQDGHRDALIIVPQSAWGERMKITFVNAWQQMGGNILGIEEINPQSNINEETKKLLSIDASEARAAELKELGLRFNFEPYRRQDPDMVFIATNAALARQIKPLLNFYYAANLPAYATSSVYSGKDQASVDQDLNGIKFCDMPWMLDKSISSRSTYKSVAKLWTGQFEQYVRLYALGLDAYKVAMQLDQLTLLPELGISGMTGMLTLDTRQQVQRKLMWASFKKGVASLDGE